MTDKDIIISDYLQTKSLAKTAIHCGLCSKTIKKILIANNIEIYNKNNAAWDDEMQIIKYYLDKHSINDTANKFGHTRKFITKVLRKNNIELHALETIVAIQQEATINTCLDKYGVKNIFQTFDFGHKPTKHYYRYKNESFDSLPELALYLYAIDHAESIIREPVRLFYSYNGKKHACYPDFWYNNRLIEIKGDHFFKEGQIINPYDRKKDGITKAKFDCYLENNVEIWTSVKYNFYLDYFYSKYKASDFITENKN